MYVAGVSSEITDAFVCVKRISFGTGRVAVWVLRMFARCIGLVAEYVTCPAWVYGNAMEYH